MDRVLDELHRALDAWVPGARASVIGSTALGLPLEPTDDVDVVVAVPNDARGTDAVVGFPASLADALERRGWDRVVAVAAARVPIVRATAPSERRVVDMQLLVLPRGDGWADAAAPPPDGWFAMDFGGTEALVEAAPAVCALRMPELLLRPRDGERPPYTPIEFQAALVRLRAWARARRVYGAANGYPPGVAWALMLAHVMLAGAGGDPVLGVLRLVADTPWGNGGAVRLATAACGDLPPWLPPTLPGIQQPMAVLTPEFEQNTTTSVTFVHLEVLVDECRATLAAAADGGAAEAWLERPPRPWFTGIVAVRPHPDTPAQLRLLIQARLPLVALQLYSSGLSIRPLGFGRSAACGSWLFGFAPRSAASRVAARTDQVLALLWRSAAFLRHKLVVDAQFADALHLLPAFEAFAPKGRWPAAVCSELGDAEGAACRRQLAGQRRDKRARTDAVPQRGRLPVPAFGPRDDAGWARLHHQQGPSQGR